MKTPLRVAALISGRGSNLQTLLDAKLSVHFVGVISNRPHAGGLQIAKEHGIPTFVVDHQKFSDRESFDEVLYQTIVPLEADLIILAGFMRILTSAFVERFPMKIINIHPSLLPAFTGTHTHERAIAAGCRIHGCSVHFVIPELDAGPIIAQAVVPIFQEDTVERLSQRVLIQEHLLYPRVLRWFSEGKVHYDGSKIFITNVHSNELIVNGIDCSLWEGW